MKGSRCCFLHLSHRERSDRPCDPGEGLRAYDRPYPLTPALSPWERGQTDLLAAIFTFNGGSNHALLGGIPG
jgi:hypothetical protein